MASKELAVAFEAWRKSLEVPELVTLLDHKDGPPALLVFDFFGVHLELFAEAMQLGGCAQYFVQGRDDVEDEPSDLIDAWLVDANASLADRALPLGEALGVLARTRLDVVAASAGTTVASGSVGGLHDLQSVGFSSDSQGSEGGSAGASKDSIFGSDIDQSCGPDADDEAGVVYSEFVTWCGERNLPLDIDALRVRFANSRTTVGTLSTSPVFEEAAEAEVLLRDLSGAGVALSYASEVGLVQLALDPCYGLHLDQALAAQLGIDPDLPLVVAVVLDDISMGVSGWQREVPTRNFVSTRFWQPLPQGTVRDRNSYGVSDLLPRLFSEFLAFYFSPPHSLKPAWFADALTMTRTAGSNFFVGLWCGISHFMRTAHSYCFVCLERHCGAPVVGKIYPCSKELCRFRYETFLISAHAELARDPKVVELHLSLAAAAADGPPESFEPFPPDFLWNNEVRSRAGAFEDRGGDPSSDNKNMPALRAAIKQLPHVEAAAAAGIECEIRDLLDRQSAGTSAAMAYKFLQFVLGSNRLLLERVVLPEHLLPDLPRQVAQFAVVQNSPAVEVRFEECCATAAGAFGAAHRSAGPCRRRYAYHGSPLFKWYSIIRNGLRVLSRTALMSTGAAFGDGIYLATNPEQAAHYCQGFGGSSYPCGLGAALQILGLVEYVDDPVWCTHYPLQGIVTVSEPEAVRIRYLLVYGKGGAPSQNPAWGALNDADVAERFAQLRGFVARRAAMEEPCVGRRSLDLDFVHSGHRPAAGDS